MTPGMHMRVVSRLPNIKLAIRRPASSIATEIPWVIAVGHFGNSASFGWPATLKVVAGADNYTQVIPHTDPTARTFFFVAFDWGTIDAVEFTVRSVLWQRQQLQ